jgi:[protein-PII] uridylyltransferase
MVGELKLLLGRPRLGEVRWRVDDGVTAEQAVITVCMIDRPGALARTAGVLTLNRIPVLSARAYTTTDGFALTRFVVGRAEGTRLDRAGGDIEAAFSGRLALDAAVRAKVVTYRQAGAEAGRLLEVRVLNEDSEHSTVIEVRSPDALGLLYAVTSGISDLDLDIHVAKVDTLASRVVDVFYVRTPAGTKLAEDQASAVATAIGHRVRQLFE